MPDKIVRQALFCLSVVLILFRISSEAYSGHFLRSAGAACPTSADAPEGNVMMSGNNLKVMLLIGILLFLVAVYAVSEGFFMVITDFDKEKRLSDFHLIIEKERLSGLSALAEDDQQRLW